MIGEILSGPRAGERLEFELFSRLAESREQGQGLWYLVASGGDGFLVGCCYAKIELGDALSSIAKPRLSCFKDNRFLKFLR